VERPGSPEGKLAVLCVGGGMVHTDRDDLAVVDMAFFYPGQMVVSALDPGGQVGSSRVWTGWLTWSTPTPTRWWSPGLCRRPGCITS
jgi:hypothetical protein